MLSFEKAVIRQRIFMIVDIENAVNRTHNDPLAAYGAASIRERYVDHALFERADSQTSATIEQCVSEESRRQGSAEAAVLKLSHAQGCPNEDPLRAGFNREHALVGQSVAFCKAIELTGVPVE